MRLLHLLLLVLLSAGCPSTEAPVDDDDTSDDDDASDDDDSTASDDDDSAALPELIGHVTALHWAPDALFEWPELHMHGVFADDFAASDLSLAEDPLGLQNLLLGPEVWIPTGQWPVPLPGEVATWDDSDFAFKPDLDTLDAGDWIAAGQHLVANRVDELLESGEGHFYDQPLEFGVDMAAQQPLEVLDLEIAGGADIPEVVLTDAVAFPEPIDLLEPDVTQYLPLRHGTDLEFRWTPTADPTDAVLIVLEGESNGLVVHALDDWGEFTVQASELLLLGEEPIASVARVISTSSVIDGVGTVFVNAISRVYLYAERVGAWRVEPAIWPPGEQVDVEIAWFDHAVDPATAFVDLGEGVTVTDLQVVDSTGHRLNLSVEIAADAPTGPRTITIGDAASSREATDAIWVAKALPEQGVCEDVLAEGPLADGAWFGTDEQLDDDTFVVTDCFDDPSGREQALPLHVAAGEELTVRLWAPASFLPTLYLASECGGEAELCSQIAPSREDTTLTWTASEDEDLLLVVDSGNFAGAQPVTWVVDIRRETVPAWLEYDYVSRGSTLDTTFMSSGEVWQEGDVTFDLGPDIAVTEVEVATDGLSAAATLTADVDAPTGSRDLTVTTAAGAATLEEALSVGRFLYTVSCEEVESMEPILPGWHEGTTELAAWDEVSAEGCLELTSGSEALLPVDVGPGETLAATVYALEDFDTLLYIKTGCDEPTLACIDAASSGEPEHIEWVAPPEGGRVWLIIDGYATTDEGEFLLELEVRP